MGLHQFLLTVFPGRSRPGPNEGGGRADRELPELLRLQAAGFPLTMRGRSVMPKSFEQVFHDHE
jgi:hypothetical protein